METIKASELYQYIESRPDIIDIYGQWDILTRPNNDENTLHCKYLTINDEYIISEEVITIVVDKLEMSMMTINHNIRDLIHSRLRYLFEQNVPNYNKLSRTYSSKYTRERALIKSCVGKQIDFTGGKKYGHAFQSDIFDFSNIVVIFLKYSHNKSNNRTFDFIRVELPIIRRKYTTSEIIENFKVRKNEINRYIIDRIKYEMEHNYPKESNIPINFFECTDLILRKDSVLQYTFDIKKEISQ